MLDEVYGGQAKDPEMQTKLLEEGIAGLDTEGLFDLAMQQATEGVLPGSGTQRITDPASFTRKQVCQSLLVVYLIWLT